MKAKTQYDNSISYCTRVIDRLEQTEGFTEKTKVIIVYDQRKYGLYNEEEWSHKIDFMIPSDGNGAITYPETLIWFLQQEMNINIDVSVDETKEYTNMKEVKELSAFPNKDCLAWIDDVLVFKMS